MTDKYQPRAIDELLDQLMPYLPAIAIEGPKGVGKTVTAARRAASIWQLDDPTTGPLAYANFAAISTSPETVLLDEWQYFPDLWNKVRRAVDDGAPAGKFLLTGSAAPQDATNLHSGAARIDSIRIRPFSLNERGQAPLLGIGKLLKGEAPALPTGESPFSPAYYAEAICQSGLPAIFPLPAMIRSRRLDAYLERIVTKDFPLQGHHLRQPSLLREWLRAYAAATSTTASYTELLDAATPGQANKPSKATALTYRDQLEQLMIVEPLPAWLPVSHTLSTLAKAPKHHLCDPALAARLLNYDEQRLLDGSSQSSQVFAQLLESLAVLTARVAAEVAGAKVYHLRTQRGVREVDIIVEGANGTIVAIEVKTSGIIKDDDAKHLNWLEANYPRPVHKVIVHASTPHYTRPDGVHVLPLAALA